MQQELVLAQQVELELVEQEHLLLLVLQMVLVLTEWSQERRIRQRHSLCCCRMNCNRRTREHCMCCMTHDEHESGNVNVSDGNVSVGTVSVGTVLVCSTCFGQLLRSWSASWLPTRTRSLDVASY